VRQAVVYALRQKPFLEANVGDSASIASASRCSLRPAARIEQGLEHRLNGDTATARQLLQEAGYDGTPSSCCTRPTS